MSTTGREKERINEDLVEKSTEGTIGQSIGELVEEQIENSEEELIENHIKESIRTREKIIKGIIIFFCSLFVIYFGVTRYFTNHFYIGSKINSISISGKTIEDAKVVIASEMQNYMLNIKEREGKSKQINLSDVNLNLNSEEELNKFKDKQNPFKWVVALFNLEDYKINIGLSYDEKLLKDKIDKLTCFNIGNIVEPKNPIFQYKDNNYVIINEVQGNKVDKDTLYHQVVNSMLRGENEIDLEVAGCYIKPQYDSKSERITKVKDVLNKYVSSKITYDFGKDKETLDGSVINKWLKVDDNLQIVFDRKRVKAYIDTLSRTYDTVGKGRKFSASSGDTIYIDGGDYGCSINKDREVENLIKDIKEGRIITREPVYSRQSVFSFDNSDIGNTYVEINLSKQHLWFYKNGSLIVQGDIVTGNISRNHSTPKGIYRLKYKQRKATLRGPGYAAPVKFWMPFNRGIGIHDASWRSAFGGGIYKTKGSHGCINTPYYVARAIYDNIKPGTPVVCY